MRESFSETDEQVKAYEHSFEVTVPPAVLQIVVLAWKKIWQVGYIKLLVDGDRVEVPFRVLMGMDFDQINETLS